MSGGANARPFATHSNHLDADLSLRIAPELCLKVVDDAIYLEGELARVDVAPSSLLCYLTCSWYCSLHDYVSSNL